MKYEIYLNQNHRGLSSSNYGKHFLVSVTFKFRIFYQRGNTRVIK